MRLLRFQLFELKNYIWQLQFYLFELKSYISLLRLYLFELKSYISQLKSCISLLQNYKSTLRNTKDKHHSYFDRQQSSIRLERSALWQRHSLISRQLSSKRRQRKRTKGLLVTHAYAHLLADVQLGSSAPAFTVSQCDSEYSRKPQDAHSLGR